MLRTLQRFGARRKILKTLLYILLTLISVAVIALLLAASVGYFIYFAIAAVLVGIIVTCVRYQLQKRRERKHPLRLHAKAEKAADRALKDIERTINKQ